MDSVIINIKTDPRIKKEAQKITSDLGLTLSSAINGFLRQLVRDKTILFSLKKEFPNAYLLASIKKSEEEIQNGEVYSFKDNKEALAFLDKQ